ncbi:MAG: hypothetical protein O7H40_02355 [Gammaproteobacteria bacterium]|nr:hypothetical protein [Gammaproteobacteria bacterium]
MSAVKGDAPIFDHRLGQLFGLRIAWKINAPPFTSQMGTSIVSLKFFKAGRRDDFKARSAQLDIAKVRKGSAAF